MAVPCPLDYVNRRFKADRPIQPWVSDFTYVSTWQGWLYVAFLIDVFARRIVGWRVSSSMQPPSCPTPWNRRCTTVNRSKPMDWSTTAIKVLSTFLFAIRNDWPRQR